jgi:hypothetical protein
MKEYIIELLKIILTGFKRLLCVILLIALVIAGVIYLCLCFNAFAEGKYILGTVITLPGLLVVLFLFGSIE